jgi:hypothetical protein
MLHYARGLYEASRVFYPKQYPFGMIYADILHIFGEQARNFYMGVGEDPFVISTPWMFPNNSQKLSTYVDNIIQFREKIFEDYKDFWVFKAGHSSWNKELLDKYKKENIAKHKAVSKN